MATAPFIDFEQIKSTVSVHMVMQMLKLDMKQTSGQFRGTCPVHAGNDRTLVVTPTKGFYCWSEKKGGDAIALCAHVRQIPMREAALAIAEHFGVGTAPAKSAPATAPQATKAKGAFDAEAYAKRLDPNHDALAALGITPETFQAFSSGYAAGGVNRGRLALPIHDREGKCVAYIGRALGDESPTMVFPNGFAAQEHIFNAHKVSEGELYLVRDPLDVLRAFEGGVENVVSFLGPMTPHNLEILAALCDERKVETIEIY